MNKTMNFIRLDLITIKPYLTIKNLIIFIALALIMIISSGQSVSGIGIIMVYSAMYVTYPFAVGEKNDIDALYNTLSIKRSTVVLGRYLFALVVDICSGVFTYCLSYVLMTMLHKDFKAWETLLITFVMFLVYSVLQAVQLPIFFKLGYTRAKFFAYLPFVGLPLAVLIFTNLLKDTITIEQVAHILEWFTTNPQIAALFGAIIWLGLMAISYQISLSYYNKRDF